MIMKEGQNDEDCRANRINKPSLRESSTVRTEEMLH